MNTHIEFDLEKKIGVIYTDSQLTDSPFAKYVDWEILLKNDKNKKVNHLFYTISHIEGVEKIIEISRYKIIFQKSYFGSFNSIYEQIKSILDLIYSDTEDNNFLKDISPEELKEIKEFYDFCKNQDYSIKEMIEIINRKEEVDKYFDFIKDLIFKDNK